MTELNTNVMNTVANADILKTVVAKAGYPKVVMGLAFIGTLGIFGVGCLALKEIRDRRIKATSETIGEEASEPVDVDVEIKIDKDDIAPEQEK